MSKTEIYKKLFSNNWPSDDELVDYAIERHGYGGDDGFYGVTYSEDLDEYDREVEGENIPEDFVEIYFYAFEQSAEEIQVPEAEYVEELKNYLRGKGQLGLALKLDGNEKQQRKPFYKRWDFLITVSVFIYDYASKLNNAKDGVVTISFSDIFEATYQFFGIWFLFFLILKILYIFCLAMLEDDKAPLTIKNVLIGLRGRLWRAIKYSFIIIVLFFTFITVVHGFDETRKILTELWIIIPILIGAVFALTQYIHHKRAVIRFVREAFPK